MRILRIRRSSARALAVLGLFAAASPAGAVPEVITAGFDYWVTRPGGAGYTFGGTSIPSGFFFPGSDPFAGSVDLEGVPLFTSPPDAAGNADTAVERLADTAPIDIAGSDTIPIQIVALNLKSVEPITVTSAGPDQLWDVRVCLTDAQSQPTGSMTITRTSQNGGTYDASLPVVPVFVFTRQGDGLRRTLDCATAAPGICDGLVLENAAVNEFVMKGAGHLDVADIGVTEAADSFDFVSTCGGALGAASGPTNFHPGIQAVGNSGVCFANQEAENALAGGTGFHEAFADCFPPVPAATGWVLVVLLALTGGLILVGARHALRPA